MADVTPGVGVVAAVPGVLTKTALAAPANDHLPPENGIGGRSPESSAVPTTSAPEGPEAASASGGEIHGNFHTPPLQPAERYFIGDGSSWATVSGARLRLLEDTDNRGTETQQDASSAACSSCGNALLSDAKFCRKCGVPRSMRFAEACRCGNKFMENAEFCRRCGEKRPPSEANSPTRPNLPVSNTLSAAPVALGGPEVMREASSEPPVPRGVPEPPVTPPIAVATNGSSSRLGSGVPSRGDSGLPSPVKTLHERLQLEYQELSRQLLSEEVAEASSQAQLDFELSELKQRSNEETSAINDLCYQIENAGFFRDELREMDEAKMVLEAELLGEQNNQQVAELRAEEEELCVRLADKEKQLLEIDTSRQSMESHLNRMKSMQAWLQGDIEDMRRTSSRVEALGKSELELKSEETERLSSELHVRLQEQRSSHDTWKAHSENEVFRLRQESKRQVLEERQLSEHIANARRDHSEVNSTLQENLLSCSREHEQLIQRIEMARQECKQQSEVDEPRYLAEQQAVFLECEQVEKTRSACLEELKAVDSQWLQSQQRVVDLKNAEATAASRGGGRITPADRQDAKRLQSELQQLIGQLQEAEDVNAELQQDFEQAGRGLFGFCRRRREPPAPGRSPPLPPPSQPPVRDPERGPNAYRDAL